MTVGCRRIVIKYCRESAARRPDKPREFLASFGLMQPGAVVSLKVFVVLTTGNESGSATLQVERPASAQLLAA